MTPPPAPRYRAVVPDLPTLEEYRPQLEAAHAAAWFSNFGPLSDQFEQTMLQALGLPEEVCVTASSATAGLSAALLSCAREGPVLVPAFTFPASLGAVNAAGRKAIITDVAMDTWTIDPSRLDQMLTRTDASVVMLVAPFGLQRDFQEQIAVCRRYGVAILIDNAAGLGAERVRRPVGPDICEVFSLHATKPFGVGEGGIVFAHREMEERVRAAMNFSLQAPGRRDLPAWGFNGKMSEMHAAIGLAQAKRFPQRLPGRQSFAARYIRQLGELNGLVMAKTPDVSPWQMFPVLLPRAVAREQAISIAAVEGLELRRYYHPSLSRWPQLTALEPCTVSETLAERMVALPVRADACGDEADRIVEIACSALARALDLPAAGGA